MNPYVIIAIVAVVFGIYITIMYSISKKRKQGQSDEFLSRLSTTELTEKQKHALSFGAILAHHRMEKVLDIVPRSGLDQYKQGLAQQWGINDSADAKNLLNRLCMLSTSSKLDQSLNTVDTSKIRKAIAKGLHIDQSEAVAVQSTYAWDLGRASVLAKWCFWLGYITESEFWAYQNKVVEVAQQKGENWKEYTISFLLGRTMSGFDLDDIIIEADQILNGKSPFLSSNNNVDIYKTYPF